MTKIEIFMSPESCQEAIEILRSYYQTIKPKLDLVCKKLAEIGAAEAQKRFARGDHGNGGVAVTTMPMANGYRILANGHDVYFIEFGTGFMTQPHGDAVSVPVYPGSYSEQNKQIFSELGYWWYGGEKLQGTEAEMPLYFAGEAIRKNYKRVMKEVFGT